MPHSTAHRVRALACFALGAAAWLAAAEEPTTQRVEFTQYSALAEVGEITRRMMSPLQSAELRMRLAAQQQVLLRQTIDLAQERFLVFVPAQTPPAGYGLLVFVSPSDRAQLPLGWAAELNRRGFIFVAADRSGNGEDVLGRRAPLALLAQENVRRQYRVDARRTYIAGFSGGSRVALRLAVAYPDVFAGAILNAGSDPIGDAALPLPPRDLFMAVQAATKFVYTTGRRDEDPRRIDAASQDSLEAGCVFGVRSYEVPNVGHEIADFRALARALDALAGMNDPPPPKLTACRAALDAKAGSEIDRIESLQAKGEREDARRAAREFDARWGGYAGEHGARLVERVLNER